MESCQHFLLSNHLVLLYNPLETIHLLLQLFPALNQRHEDHRYNIFADLVTFLNLEDFLQAQIILLCLDVVAVDPMTDSPEVPEVEQSIVSP